MSQPPPKTVPDEINRILSLPGFDFFKRLADALYFLWESFNKGLIRFPSYTVAAVPNASKNTGRIIYVSDETGGATLAFSDGTSWRRVQDRAVIS